MSKFTEQENRYRPSDALRPRTTSITPMTQSLRPGLSSMRVFRNSTRRPRKRSPVVHGVDLNGADLTVIEVDGAGEAVAFFGNGTTEDIDHADDPVIATGVVVDAGVQEFHAPAAEAVA
ncbi:MAG: hypothetical protein NTW28_08105, partial [Candidatus Solibacter sp.]|nr:hypothetical protein [Candidatus Solibacter sp.]